MKNSLLALSLLSILPIFSACKTRSFNSTAMGKKNSSESKALSEEDISPVQYFALTAPVSFIDARNTPKNKQFIHCFYKTRVTKEKFDSPLRIQGKPVVFQFEVKSVEKVLPNYVRQTRLDSAINTWKLSAVKSGAASAGSAVGTVVGFLTWPVWVFGGVAAGAIHMGWDELQDQRNRIRAINEDPAMQGEPLPYTYDKSEIGAKAFLGGIVGGGVGMVLPAGFGVETIRYGDEARTEWAVAKIAGRVLAAGAFEQDSTAVRAFPLQDYATADSIEAVLRELKETDQEPAPYACPESADLAKYMTQEESAASK